MPTRTTYWRATPNIASIDRTQHYAYIVNSTCTVGFSPSNSNCTSQLLTLDAIPALGCIWHKTPLDTVQKMKNVKCLKIMFCYFDLVGILLTTENDAPCIYILNCCQCLLYSGFQIPQNTPNITSALPTSKLCLWIPNSAQVFALKQFGNVH